MTVDFLFAFEPLISEQSAIMTIEGVFSGLEYPTGIVFIGPNDILAIEKNKGTVQRIVNGEISNEPLLDLNVNAEIERGLLGIAASRTDTIKNNKTFIFLYFTEAKDNDGGMPIGNHLYRYELTNNKLVNPKLLLNLPFLPGPAHNGGVITVGPDNNLYIVVGNLISQMNPNYDEYTMDQNVKNGSLPTGSGGILRVTQDGKLVNGKGLLGDEFPLRFYYAYGIRNSFGIAFDPLTGYLWDTENGGKYDEINLVDPGFNSGWSKIVGKASSSRNFDQNDLVNFTGKGNYSDPEFSWLSEGDFRIAPTSIVFLVTDKYTKEFRNDMLVGDVSGNIYHFELSSDRTKLLLSGDLSDKVADNASEIEPSIFVTLQGTITDLDVGPDGYLYATVYDKQGGIFKILPSQELTNKTN